MKLEGIWEPRSQCEMDVYYLSREGRAIFGITTVERESEGNWKWLSGSLRLRKHPLGHLTTVPRGADSAEVFYDVILACFLRSGGPLAVLVSCA